MTDQTNNTALGSRRDFLGLAMGAVAAGTDRKSVV